MTPTDTTEPGLESLICDALTGAGWTYGDPGDYDRDSCVDVVQLAAFLHATRPEVAEALDMAPGASHPGPHNTARRRFLRWLQGEISRKGVMRVLRYGVDHGRRHLELFSGALAYSQGMGFEKNRFTVVRQLRYSQDDPGRALDLVLFINGLPVFTIEVKNRLSQQTLDDAVRQYRRDRDPDEMLFESRRCVAHFVVDEREVRFCSGLDGNVWFQPFNRGLNDGAGDPPNANRIETDYLWRDLLTRESLTHMVATYTQVVKGKDPRTGKTRRYLVWPRYPQHDVLRGLLDDVQARGAGGFYQIRHSGPPGKNFMVWLAQQLIGLEKDGDGGFDSVIVVTNRPVTDRESRGANDRDAQVGAWVGHPRPGYPRRFIESGKEIVISTVRQFIMCFDDVIGNARRLAVIIDKDKGQDEERSGQCGCASKYMREVVFFGQRLGELHRRFPDASFFTFAATRENGMMEPYGALQLFGALRRIILPDADAEMAWDRVEAP